MEKKIRQMIEDYGENIVFAEKTITEDDRTEALLRAAHVADEIWAEFSSVVDKNESLKDENEDMGTMLNEIKAILGD